MRTAITRFPLTLSLLVLSACDATPVEDAGLGDTSTADTNVGVIPAEWSGLYFGEEDGFSEPMPMFLQVAGGLDSSVTVCSLTTEGSMDPLRGNNCDRNPVFDVRDGQRLRVEYTLPWPERGGAMPYLLSVERQSDGSFSGSLEIPSGIILPRFALSELSQADYDAMF